MESTKIKIVFSTYHFILLHVVYCGRSSHPDRSAVQSFHAVRFALSDALYRVSIVEVDRGTNPLILGESLLVGLCITCLLCLRRFYVPYL